MSEDVHVCGSLLFSFVAVCAAGVKRICENEMSLLTCTGMFIFAICLLMRGKTCRIKKQLHRLCRACLMNDNIRFIASASR